MNMFAHDRRADRMVGESATVIKRLHFLMKELVIAQAGWMPSTLHWETKLLLPEILWQDSLAFDALRERLLELRYPERRIEAGPDESFILGWRELLRNAPSDLAFATALTRTFKPFVLGAFQRYLETTDHLDDAPTVRILRHTISDLTAQMARLSEVCADAATLAGPAGVDEAEAWARSVNALLEQFPVDQVLSSEGILIDPSRWHLPGSRPFTICRESLRDPRFARARFSWPDSLEPARGAGEGFQLQVRQAQAHLNEMWAAEMACAVIFDLGPDGPAEFLVDASRWGFDEIRHCRMGYQRFLHWGFQKQDMPLGCFPYDVGASLDPLGRLGLIFYFETTFIHTKSERARTFSEFGDRTSSHDMDFDWADELIHTYYGKKWLGHFLQTSGDGRTLRDVKNAAASAVDAYRDSATPADRDRTEELFDQVLRKAAELAAPAAPV